MNEIKELLYNHKKVSGESPQYTEILTRFNLLTYFINVDASTRFINERLYLNLPVHQPNQSNSFSFNNKNTNLTLGQEESSTSAFDQKKSYPTVLNDNQFENETVLRQALKKDDLYDISYCSWSLIEKVWPDLTLKQKEELLGKLLLKPVVESVPLTNYLKDTLGPCKGNLVVLTSKVDQLPLYNLTLNQLDKLIKILPSLLDVGSFVSNYLEKLVPSSYIQQFKSIGDYPDMDGWNHLNNPDGALYLDALDKFANQLVNTTYANVKSRITFYKLRSNIVRGEFDKDLLISYLKQSYTKKNHDNVHHPMLFVKYYGPGINIPLIGNCNISDKDESEVFDEYLSGLLKTQKVKDLNSFSTYFNYKTYLEPLQQKVLLTYGLAKKDDIITWARDTAKYESFVKQTKLAFDLSTLYYHNQRLTVNDSIKLDLSIKNIPNVTLRVFPIDLYNYWKLHADQSEIKDGDKLNVDGLCPIYEQQFDYSNIPSIETINEKLIFGGDHQGESTSDIFNGRGAWVFDFVGGRDQSRAIVQKGFLRYIVQNTTGGHVFLILDEKNQLIKEKCTIWYENNSYESDESGNILIPYRVKESKRTRALIVTEDGYCQPFYHYFQQESYDLDATFYINHETLIPTKQAKVIVSPKLKVQYQVASLKLLEKISLTLTTTSGNDIKSSTTVENIKVSNDKPIEFEFTVPNSLKKISMELSAQVKTMFGKDPYKKVECKHELVSNTSASDDIANYQLRKINNDYYFNIIGKNGEPLQKRSVEIMFHHKMLQGTIDITMQTDNNGVINLGSLKNVYLIYIQNPFKQWSIDENQINASLPTTIHEDANTEIKLPFLKNNEHNCLLFQTGVRGISIADFTSRIQSTESGIIIQNGLPEGTYSLYYRTPTNIHGDTISINIYKNKLNCTKQLWNNWVISEDAYMEKSGDIIKDPLFIANINHDNDTIKLQLKGSTASLAKASVIITSSTFVPTINDSLPSIYSDKYRNNRLEFQNIENQVSDPIYLTGRKLSEEYRYILNRSKEDKYIGSTLTEPSLLINPKKNSSTFVITRSAGQGYDSFNSAKQRKRHMLRHAKNAVAEMYCGGLMQGPSREADFNYGFLNHSTKILTFKPNGNGEVLIDRSKLGDGNLLQVIVVSDGQLIGGLFTLTDLNLAMNINDQRQTDQGLNMNGAYLRNKTITILSSSHAQDTLTIDQNQKEFELIDSQDALLDIFRLLAKGDTNSLSEFDVIRRWNNLSDDEKVKTFNKLNSHEFNLWLKFKDVDFFDTKVKPLIKSKIYKAFMDDYLIDADLTKYSNNLYSYKKLSTVEKALLAKRVPDILPVVLQSFKDTFEPPLSDQPFDTVLAGNSLNLPPPPSPTGRLPPPPPPSAPADMPFGFQQQQQQQQQQVSNRSMFLSSNAPAAYGMSFGAFSSSNNSAPITAAAAAAPSARMKSRSIGFGSANNDSVTKELEVVERMEMDVVQDEEDGDEDDGDDQNDGANDNELEKIQSELRQRAIKLGMKRKYYEYIESTSEWTEKSYYGNSANSIKVKQFWIDYLENELDVFVSGHIIYATSNITEMIFALALTDLPSKSKVNYDITPDLTNGKVFIVAKTPIIIFYRALKEYSQSHSTNPFILLGQHFFEKNETSIDTDEQHIVEPNQLLTETPYGWHLAVSNISNKTKVCELTLQIPTGAIPLSNTPYSQSKIIRIKPYSTWREVIGSFYFPEKGNFHHFAVTIGEQRKSTYNTNSNEDPLILLNQTQPISLVVSNINDGLNDMSSQINNEGGRSSHLSWLSLNNTASDNDVITFVERYDTSKLKQLDWSLVHWRMLNSPFARSLLTVLVKHKFYVKSIYAYGLYHRFSDIISDLLEQEGQSLLKYIGINFESSLIKLRPYEHEYLKILDYYPAVNARAHCLGSYIEIINKEFYNQYNQFLNYLNQGITRKFNDYVIFSIYLLIQGRIHEAKRIFEIAESIKHQEEEEDNNELAYIQADYLKAYLATRIKVDETVDIALLKEYVQKYKSCASLRWQKQGQSMNDLVNQLENGIHVDPSSFSDENDNDHYNKSISSDPVFDFTIKNNQVVIRYANLTQCQVRFYKINVEVMFSNQPFLNKTDNTSDYSWVKANHKETIDLTTEQLIDDTSIMQIDDNDEENGFEWIGVQKVKRQRHVVPIPLTGNVLVEVSAHGKTQCQTHLSHSLTVHVSEQYGVARVLKPTNNNNDDDDDQSQQQKPLSGVYVKAYVKLDNGKVEFWKDGYTSLTGVFDYISVTQGNGLLGNSSSSPSYSSNQTLKNIMKKVKKFSLLFTSEEFGVVTKEAYPPF
ncbi:unnamed protein product [Cunninghamella blakesleeana]